MIELPEAIALSKQMNEMIRGKSIKRVTVGHSPHKWAWYYKNPEDYPERLEGRTIGASSAFGSFVGADAGPSTLLFSEGVRLRYLENAGEAPKKHQLLLEFDDGSALVASIQMYGGLYCFPSGQFDNPYYKNAMSAPKKNPYRDGDGGRAGHREGPARQQRRI